jgi:hypothetical protein
VPRIWKVWIQKNWARITIVVRENVIAHQKMSSHTRRPRISNIHVDVYEREFTRNKACNIVAELGERWTLGADGVFAHRQPAARAVGLGSSSGCARLAENVAAQPKIPAQDKRVSHDF